MKFHDLSKPFPMMSEEELCALAEDIRLSGQRVPISVYGGQILDGRNRWKACQKAGVKPWVEEYDGEDPLGWVVSLNIKRRHMNESQRAMVAAKLANMAHGATLKKGSRRPNSDFGEVSLERAAQLLNVSRAQVADAKLVLREEPKAVAEIEAGRVSVHKAKRKLARRQAVAKVAKAPGRKYRVIYADPPWWYGDSREDLKGTTGASAHYPSMRTRDIGALPVGEWTEPNAVLFLWVTSPLLEDGLEVVKEWGFEYKASFVWDKVGHNLGHYNSVRHEFLLVCTRGSCLPDNPKLHDSVQSIQKSGRHSEKPEAFRQIIDNLYPHGRRLEMFSRRKVEGWDAYGNDANA